MTDKRIIKCFKCERIDHISLDPYGGNPHCPSHCEKEDSDLGCIPVKRVLKSLGIEA